MHAITLHQPWASLIALGIKDKGDADLVTAKGTHRRAHRHTRGAAQTVETVVPGEGRFGLWLSGCPGYAARRGRGDGAASKPHIKFVGKMSVFSMRPVVLPVKI